MGAEHRGPLPTPGMLDDYNSVLPGLAERIVQMAERERHQAHRMQRWEGILRFSGQGAAFVIAWPGSLLEHSSSIRDTMSRVWQHFSVALARSLERSSTAKSRVTGLERHAPTGKRGATNGLRRRGPPSAPSAHRPV